MSEKEDHLLRLEAWPFGWAFLYHRNLRREDGLIQLELTEEEAEKASAKVQDKLQTEGFALDYSSNSRSVAPSDNYSIQF